MLLPLKNYPSLDVHGETRDTIYTVLKEFIDDNLKLGNEVVVIIHGKGKGILKKEIHLYLKKMKGVLNFFQDSWNEGVTIVYLENNS